MKKLILLAAAALALASCDNNVDNPDNSPQPAKVYATIGETSISRAAETSWASGDEIGISSSVGEVDGPYINVKYTTTGDGKFTGETPLFFYKPMTLTAYYPFADEEGETPGDNGVITATTDAENQKAGKQPLIDFLWDSMTNQDQKDFSATDPQVNFTFSHKMSKLTFIFISSDPTYDKNNVLISDGVDVSTMVAYDIEKLIVDGTFNTATGVCAADDNAADENRGLEMVYDKGFVKDKEPVPSLIIFPQTLPEGNLTLRIFTDELDPGSPLQEYKCSLSFSSGEIKPGCHYKYSIQVTKHGLMVGDVTIEDWSNEPDRFLTATIDGDPNFK